MSQSEWPSGDSQPPGVMEDKEIDNLQHDALTDAGSGPSARGAALPCVFKATVHKDASPTSQGKESASRDTNLGTCGSDLCATKGCVTAAAELISAMEDSADPCQDFYKFACGGFLRKTVIPDEKTSYNRFSESSDVLEQNLRILVEADVTVDDTPSTIMVKNLFKSCTDVDQVAERGLDPLKEVLKELKGWPVVEGNAWDPDSFHWTTNLYKHRQLGYSIDYLFGFSVVTDLRNTTRRILSVDQPILGMKREYLIKGFNNSDVQAYYQYQNRVASLIGADKDMALKELKASLEFEIELANFSMSKEERRNITKLYNMMTLADLQVIAPNIPWLEYINTVLTPFHTVTNKEPIIVSNLNYLRNISLILGRTEPRVLANYLAWRVTKDSVTYLSEEVRAMEQAYTKKLTGKATREPRWKECINMVSDSLKYSIGSIYVKNIFKEESKASVEEMVTYIRRAFDSILQKVDWMDEETRGRALAKAHAIASFMGYPDEILEEEKLLEVYEGLTLNTEDLLGNLRNISVYKKNFHLRRLREAVDKKDWKNFDKSAVVNAHYNSIYNSIKFPAGILQGAFFNADRPKYMNFGGIGFVIGHEITHGFDDKGRQFAANGDLSDWWETETRDNFLKKAQCIVDQYGNYTDPEVDMKLNGIGTQGENIADNGGIKEAYYAYLQYVKDHGEEPTLPGLPYSSRQLFWISSANVWCAKYRKESLIRRIETGVHSPGRFRVNGPLGNAIEFSQDWGCPLGSPMNPTLKCTVW